jgi:hypothetical protein
MPEGQRTAVYVADPTALLLIGWGASYRALLPDVWVAIVVACTYSRLTRLFTSRLGLIDPIAGYWLSEPRHDWQLWP